MLSLGWPRPINYLFLKIILTLSFAGTLIFTLKRFFRTLKSGGIFITQQIGENDKENIKNAFWRGQAFGEKTGTLMNKY